MVPETFWPVPYLLDPHHVEMDATVSFVVSVLLVLMINAEAQAWVAAFLGDARKNAKDRFHFNAFLHLDVWGTWSYIVGGFGWPRLMDIDQSKLKYPRAYTILIRLAGPVANILLANIAASLVFVMKFLSLDPRVFYMVMGVSVTTAVYNLLPIPPLWAGYLWTVWLPRGWQKYHWWVIQVGSATIVSLSLIERWTHQGIISPYFTPLIHWVFNLIKG